MMGLTDIHAHIVYGMDDGPATREEMYAMLDAAHREGIVHLFATPHVIPGLRPFRQEAYLERLDMARAYCREKGYPITLYTGAEVLYTPAILSGIRERKLPTLADSDWVLVEFSPGIAFPEMEKALLALREGGYAPILAHGERYQYLCSPGRLSKLRKRHQVLCQVNASTVIRPHGLWRRWMVHWWLKKGLVDFIASDAHNTTSRPFYIRRAYEELKKKKTPYTLQKWMNASPLQKHE